MLSCGQMLGAGLIDLTIVLTIVVLQMVSCGYFVFRLTPRRSLINLTTVANKSDGRCFAINTKTLFCQPETIRNLPRSVSRTAISATFSAVIPESFLSVIPARTRNSVCVIPGQSTETCMFCDCSSFCNAAEKFIIKALPAL